jgi:hypothetical protein
MFWLPSREDLWQAMAIWCCVAVAVMPGEQGSRVDWAFKHVVWLGPSVVDWDDYETEIAVEVAGGSYSQKWHLP